MPAEVYREDVDPDADNNPHSYAIQMTGSGRHVLEVGCAVGHVTERLVERGNTVVGVEIDPVAAEAAREFAERVHVADLDVTQLSELDDDSFDVIMFGDVLEHLRDPTATLVDSLTRLAPDGHVIISVPNVAHIDVRLMLLEGRWEYQGTGLLDATHLRWFTKASLRQLLDDAGLRAVRLERVRIGRYGSDIDLDPTVPRHDVLAYIESDPEASTFQYVVEAVRVTELSDAQRMAPDPLADRDLGSRPRLDHGVEIAALVADRDGQRQRAHELDVVNQALRAQVDAWEHSTLARVTRPARSLWGRIRRRLGR